MRAWLFGICILIAPGALDAQVRSVEIPACGSPAVADSDGDSLGDECESRLAHAFAPELVVRAGGCNWDTSRVPHRLGGAYLFAVAPRPGGARVLYLPAYFMDCGWSGLKCALPWVNCSPHAGDSEFIAIDAVLDSVTKRWRPDAVFLSAHCFGRSGGDCRWYRGGELEGFTWNAVSPTIWVADGRQANYPNVDACDRGHHRIDSCDRHDYRYRYPIEDADQNIGSAAKPNPESGCLEGAMLANPRVAEEALECMWTPDRPFRGWQSSGSGVTGYWRYLIEVAALGIVPSNGGSDGG